MYLVQVLDQVGNVTQTLLETADLSEAMSFAGTLNYQGERNIAIVQKNQLIEFAVVDHFDEAGRFREVWSSIDEALEAAAQSPAEYRVSLCRMRPGDILEAFGDVQQLGSAILRVNESEVMERWGVAVSDPEVAYLTRLLGRLGSDARSQLLEVAQSIANSDSANPAEMAVSDDDSDETEGIEMDPQKPYSVGGGARWESKCV